MSNNLLKPSSRELNGPHVLISPDSTKKVSDMQLNGSVIAVEESEAAVDPLELFDEVLYNIEINACNV